MIEITTSLFKTFFIAFGITHGPDVFASKEFNIPTNMRFQALTMCIYLYLDTTEGMARKALKGATNKLESYTKGYTAAKTEDGGVPVMFGRA